MASASDVRIRLWAIGFAPGLRGPAWVCSRTRRLPLGDATPAAPGRPRSGVGSQGARGETGTVNTADFYTRGEAESHFVQGSATLIAGRARTGLAPAGVTTILAIPGVALLSVLNCNAGAANVSIANRGSGTDLWEGASNYVGTNWLATSTPLAKTAESTFHIGSGVKSSSLIATVNITTAATGSECIFAATAQVIRGG
jgi:hypothetical protein